MFASQRTIQAMGLEFYKQMYEIWMRTTSEMIEQVMRNPAFATYMGKTLDQSLDFKRQVDQWLEAWLKNLRFATDSDMKTMLTELRAIESTLTQSSLSLSLRDMKNRIDSLEQEMAKGTSSLHLIEDKLTEALFILGEVTSRMTALEHQIRTLSEKSSNARP